MDFDKVARVHTALSTTLLTVCTEEEATSEEALTAAMRMFSHLVAAYVAGTPAVHTAVARDAAIDAHCRDAAALAKVRLRDVGHDAPLQGEEEPG
jgi:hypothetical protein